MSPLMKTYLNGDPLPRFSLQSGETGATANGASPDSQWMGA